MTRLKNNNNIEADGIRDVYLNYAGNGSSSATAINSTKIWERQPYRNGQLMTSANHANGSTINKWSDFGGTFFIKAGVGTWQTTSTKSTTNHTLIGWGTAGGVQAASNGNLTSAQGTLYDGTTAYTTSAKPFDHLDSSFDGNKWLSFFGHLTVSSGFSTTYTGMICFEGSGASTGDTDWTSCFHEHDLEDTSGNTASSSMDFYGSSKTTAQLNRTGAAQVVSRYSRVVYEYSGTIIAFGNSTDSDYNKYVKFT